MRVLEILVLATLLIAFIGFFVPRSKRPRWMAYLPALAVLLVLAHLVLEGYRWQMVLAYALTALTFLATVPGIVRLTRLRPRGQADPQGKPSSRWHRALTIIATILGLLQASCMAISST